MQIKIVNSQGGELLTLLEGARLQFLMLVRPLALVSFFFALRSPKPNSNHNLTPPRTLTLFCRFTKTDKNKARNRQSGGGFGSASGDSVSSASAMFSFSAPPPCAAGTMGSPSSFPGNVQHGVAPPVPPMSRQAVAQVEGGCGIGAVSFVISQPATIRLISVVMNVVSRSGGLLERYLARPSVELELDYTPYVVSKLFS